MLYDKSNIKYFYAPSCNAKLICNMCECATTYDDSVSYKGLHLICNGCAYRISTLLGMTFGEIVIALHTEGEKIMRDKDRHSLDKEPI